MKVGIFTDTYSPQTNGVVTSVKIYAEQLRLLGHEVHIFAPALAGSGPDPERVYRFYGISYFGQPEYKWVLPWAKGGFRQRDIPALGLDIIHIQAPFGLGLMGAHLARKYSIPAVFTYHTFFEPYLHYLPGPRWFYFRLHKNLTRLWSNRFPIVLCPTLPIKDALLRYGITSRIELLPTGIDLHNMKPSGWQARSELGIPEGVPLFATAGRLGREKSFDLLLKAMREARSRVPDAHLVVAGDGPERDSLVQLAADLGLKERVHFTGYLARERVIDLFAASQLFVFASQSETQGMVLLEAMAQGTPAVAVDALGPGELMRGDRGGLLAEPEAQDLADKIARLATDGALRAEKSREALAKAEEYSAERLAKKLVRFYQLAIASSNRA